MSMNEAARRGAAQNRAVIDFEQNTKILYTIYNAII